LNACVLIRQPDELGQHALKRRINELSGSALREEKWFSRD
jgi:hypothetical protein